MNLKRTLVFLFVATAGIIIFSTTAFTSNNGKPGYTGSPGENKCNNSGCHSSNALNSGGGSVIISSPDMPNWTYSPGTTYTINVQVKKTGCLKFGFGFEALLPSGANGGLISTASSTNAKTMSATVSGNSRTNAVHKQPNHFSTDSLVFSFHWIAPAAGAGNITFYATGNATNSSNSTAGDFIYSTNQLITEASTIDIEAINASLHKLSLYPNPAANVVNIAWPQNLENTSSQFQIFDLNGRLVHEQAITQSAGANSSAIDIAFLNEGIYYVQIQNGNWKVQDKMIVVK